MVVSTDLAVVWDMGGIFREYFTEPMIRLGRARGWPLDDVALGPTHHVADPAYESMITGAIDESDYLAGILDALAAFGIDYHPRRDPEWQPELRPATWALIEDIHAAGRRQAILTNDASKWRGERWWEVWDDARYFDAIVDVATLEHRKPHPDTYRAACAAIGRSPDTCIFIDDMTVNCEGAEAVGMQSQFFDLTDPDGSIAQLRERIGL